MQLRQKFEDRDSEDKIHNEEEVMKKKQIWQRIKFDESEDEADDKEDDIDEDNKQMMTKRNTKKIRML